MSDDLTISGGSSGIAATLDDLRQVAQDLGGVCDDLTRIGTGATAVAARPELVASVALSPPTGVRALESLGRAAAQVGLIDLRVGTTAFGIRAAARAYEIAESTSAVLVDSARAGTGYAVGLAIDAMTPALLIAGAGTLLIRGGLQTTPGGRVAWQEIAHLGESVGAQRVEDMQALLWDHPELTDDIGGGAVGLIGGLSSGDPLLATVFGVGLARSGSTWPPSTYADGTEVIAGVGELFGLFADGGPVSVRQVARSDGAVVPHGVADLMADEGDLDGMGPGSTDGAHGFADGNRRRLRVIQQTQPDGSSSWVVIIPGTQDWSTHSGSDLFDLTTNVHLMTGQDTAVYHAVSNALARAMASAHVPAGQPVMLAGYSLGGIAAAGLAANADFRRRFNLTNLVTAGAPIARFPVPRSVGVLSMENLQDPIPRLEGEPNPDRPNWITVSRNVSGDVLPRGAGSVRIDGDPIEAHFSPIYQRTGRDVDRADAAALRRWRSQTKQFFSGRGTIRDYLALRGHSRTSGPADRASPPRSGGKDSTTDATGSGRADSTSP